MAIVFKTPGAIPLDAFTTFGINTKPNTTSPIGFFGTGLKYAVAVLCRLGVEVEVWSGATCYVFYAAKGTFRDKEFNFIRMKKRNGVLAKWVGHSRLPFTTELGKNWQLWQVFRELESNTRDELGQTFEFDDSGEHEIVGQDGYSMIIIRNADFTAVFNHRDEIFLPGAVAKLPGAVAQVMTESSKHLYYRGLRVWDTPKPCVVTWNILAEMQLTEDRTLASQYMASYYAVRHIVSSTDKEFIKKVLRAEEGFWEHSLDYSVVTAAPTPEFLEVSRIYGRRSHVGSYLSVWDPKPPKRFDDWRMELLDALVPPEGMTIDWEKVNPLVRANHAKLVGLLRESYNRDNPPKFETLDGAAGLTDQGLPPAFFEVTPDPVVAAFDTHGGEPRMIDVDYSAVENRVLSHMTGTLPMETVTGRLNPPGPEMQKLPASGVPDAAEHPEPPPVPAKVIEDKSDDIPF